MVVVALRPPSSPSAAKPVRRLATPLWSVRHVPQPVVDRGRHAEARHRAHRRRRRRHLLRGAGRTRRSGVGIGPGAADPRVDPEAPDLHGRTRGSRARLQVRDPCRRRDEVKNGAVDKLWLVGAGDPAIATPEAEAALNAARSPSASR